MASVITTDNDHSPYAIPESDIECMSILFNRFYQKYPLEQLPSLTNHTNKEAALDFITNFFELRDKYYKYINLEQKRLRQLRLDPAKSPHLRFCKLNLDRVYRNSSNYNDRVSQLLARKDIAQFIIESNKGAVQYYTYRARVNPNDDLPIKKVLYNINYFV